MTDRPLITFALFAYNQEKFIEEAVLGVFYQTYSPLEIILSDDGSSDNTFEIMSRMASEYVGPHTIVLNRNQPNIGLIQHVNKVVDEISKGEIVVMAAGDDISFMDRVDKTWLAFCRDPNIFSVSMNFQMIDESGKHVESKFHHKESCFSLDDYLNGELIPKFGCTRAYRKILFDVFGPLAEFNKTEDVPLMFRTILLGKSYHVEDEGVFYRDCCESISKNIDFKFREATYRQISSDLVIANERNIVDRLRLDRLSFMLSEELRLNYIWSLLPENEYKWRYYCRNVLLVNDFSAREKILLFKVMMWNCKIITSILTLFPKFK